jgi:hypothetical protein
MCPPASAAVYPLPVSVFPTPGSRVASPRAQIAFRGLPASELGAIVVVGSRSAVHTGTIVADSDGQGGSFLPTQRFTPGELVTVSTDLEIVGASNGTFQFTVATPAGGLPPIHWPPAARARGDVWRFHSRPDLAPASVAITKRAPGSPGDIFIAPQFGPVQDGPEIVDPNGNLVWFDPLSGDTSASDFRVQAYLGNPVLTWWQGYVTAGVGVGQDEIYNSSYQPIATVHGANGLSADLHEFQLTPWGTALITAYFPVYWNASSVHGSKQQIVLDSVVQEIDIPTGLVLFQWDSLDHVPVTATFQPLPRGRGGPFDYFHVNSVQIDFDGNFVISGRNTWAAYKVDSQTGAVMWTLGGRQSSFRLATGAAFAFQHDVRVRAGNDLFVTVFDDGAGPPTVHSQSRGLKLILDFKHMTARAVAQHVHVPAVSASFEGNFQQLADRDDFVGWGQQPYFSEYDPRGRLDLSGQFVGANASYRAYRFPWTASLTTPPAVTVTGGRHPIAYATWNGATNVAFWHALAGAQPQSMRYVAGARKTSFETAMGVAPGQKFVAVQAFNAAGQLLGVSATVTVP